MRLQEARFLYIQALSYKGLSNKKSSQKIGSIAKGALDLIPVLGAYRNYKKLSETSKLRSKWENNQANYMYDARFSRLNLAKYAINMLGLGILLIPLKLVATAMNQLDIKRGKVFDNPHFLKPPAYSLAKDMNDHSDMWYKSALRGNEGIEENVDYIKRMTNRNHIQEPYKVMLSLYPDPRAKDGDHLLKRSMYAQNKKYDDKHPYDE